ncbi:hypothetical protein MUY27_17010 [Mucilaginibacter sp. RS28]|uniref:Lipocalin-like domain-containing protein n=1 Tax=Mucilaginibacter straminoryzae TaxID=2932774 RepID=A0A9X1X5M6_9SPHI|nr:hypothetical protein [Mucilaginibacter straminoryzae]MCJ8211421.1 hypothetical protein [Mucilaginibacter straminoryzae]
MKKLIAIVSIALVAMGFSLKAVSDKELGLVGEWAAQTKNTGITTMKFFPNGLLNIQKGLKNQVAHYKITYYQLDNEVQLAGKIYLDGAMPFSAKIKDRKLMELTVNSGDSTHVLNLVKVKDIKTGLIPVN